MEQESQELELVSQELEQESQELKQESQELKLEPQELEQESQEHELELETPEHAPELEHERVESHAPVFDTVENVQPGAQMAICVDTTYCITFLILLRKRPVSDCQTRFHLCDKQDI